ncbi:ATPase [Novosphingobium sp. PhB165]|uniref:ATPase n=1 Tax=Novosphingobium sp. PhB165 TaxID=2485105 RepID=UPI001FB2A328|nr:ATPase [Novosphingobium sp. PhB165]
MTENEGDAMPLSQEEWHRALAPAALTRGTGAPKWLLPALAAFTAAAWTGFFLGSQWPLLNSLPLVAIPATVTTWAVPLLLIGLVWLLAMRHSAREGKRFGDVARTLSRESANLEKRLTAVNRELSLAREFVAAQSRDLEALGRIATERLSQNAERLQDLIRENGGQVDSISTVSATALDNMEKLRSQLPVIASSAKDVTNNIGNAGRAAHVQLEDMINGFNRLNEFGSASERQVSRLREAVATALDEFTTRTDRMGTLADERFAVLNERGEAFRTELERHEVEALAGIRTRANALETEIAETRAQLDRHEEESLTSLRARLIALREESDVVSRALRDSEGRAAEDWRKALEELEDEQREVGRGITRTQDATIGALKASLNAIAADAEQLDGTIAARRERLAAELDARQSRQSELERAAITRIEAMLGDLDAGISERLERHRLQAATLGEQAGAITAELERYQARFDAIAVSSENIESRLAGSLGSLTERLTAARATLAATDGDVETLTQASVRLLELIQGSARYAHNDLPESLALSEDRLNRLQAGIAALLASLRESAGNGLELAGTIETSGLGLKALTTELAEAQAELARSGTAHGKLLDELRQSVSAIEIATDDAAGKAQGELRDAVSALQAALAGSVEAIEGDSAERIARVAQELGDESAQAIDKAMRQRVAEVTGQLDQAVAHASGATREATIQLRDQLAKVDELVGNLENRVAHARERAEEEIDNDFARRVALITESLNSNAIDIATSLSADVSDTAWAAYLRGDRGIFTRRAVALLDAGEVKSIQHLFERETAFREHVSRYIHDFEAILRQVLSTRDGNALGVTLLSSDMGKLYVALAQAIERLRN